MTWIRGFNEQTQKPFPAWVRLDYLKVVEVGDEVVLGSTGEEPPMYLYRGGRPNEVAFLIVSGSLSGLRELGFEVIQ